MFKPWSFLYWLYLQEFKSFSATFLTSTKPEQKMIYKVRVFIFLLKKIILYYFETKRYAW